LRPSPEISVVVCMHNSRSDYLQRVLEALRMQTLSNESWELVLVDNASAVPPAETLDLSWHPVVRHVREEQLGVIRARRRGIAEARGELVVYVDDDTTISPRFLAEALAIAKRHAHLGVFGAGIVEPEYEAAIPPHIRSRQAVFSIRHVATPRWSNNVHDTQSVPWGAGLCVRRPIAVSYQQFVQRLETIELVGRRGRDLFAGEDDLFSWVSVSSGLGFGIFPQLRVTHLIAASRLSRSHVLRAIHDHAFSHAILRYVLTGVTPTRIDLFRYVQLALHGMRNGWFSARCQWAESRAADRAATFIVEQRLASLTPLTVAEVTGR
jgi:glycosyltransferase involved in cell wall biosynthesis